MNNRELASAFYEQIAKLGTALSSPPRLRLLTLLCQCERTVESLANTIGLPIATVSHHLQHLRRVHLVVSRKSGRHVIYALADESVKAFWLQYLEFCPNRIDELKLLRSDLTAKRKERGAVARQDLPKLLKSGKTTLLDLRPKQEYDAGHLPGAISCPFDHLAQCIQKLPASQTVVLYCRGPYCLMGDMAQEQLAAKGIKALQLEDGVAEWSVAGLPIKRSPSYKSVISAAVP